MALKSVQAFNSSLVLRCLKAISVFLKSTFVFLVMVAPTMTNTVYKLHSRNCSVTRPAIQ